MRLDCNRTSAEELYTYPLFPFREKQPSHSLLQDQAVHMPGDGRLHAHKVQVHIGAVVRENAVMMGGIKAQNLHRRTA